MIRRARIRGGLTRVALALALVKLALTTPAGAIAQQYFPADQEVQARLRSLVEAGATPGIVLGLLEADGSTRVFHYGESGPGAPPLGPRSVFEIGSITKTFTGAVLADMVARGEVAYDDPVAKYLPEGVTVPSRDGGPITLLHLATHRSGLPRLPTNHRPADMADPYADYSVETMYAFLSSHELRRAPGGGGEYSNLGFGLLGHALGRAAGMPFSELVRERILEPLGMTMTGYDLEGELAAWSTRGHGRGEPVAYWFGTDAIHGAGGLRSNVEDMLKYLAANVGAPTTALERALRDAHRPRAPINDAGWHIAVAWQVQEHEGGTAVQHGGATGGYSTYMGFDPEKRVGFVLLTNTTQFRDVDLVRDLLRRGRRP